MILDLVRAGLAAPPKEGVRARMERLGAERRRAVAEAVAEAPAWKRPLLRLAARAVERHLPLREAGKHYLLMAFPRLRALLFELGSRLAASGALELREDVFFLDLRELDAIAHGRRDTRDLRARVAARRERFARFAGSAPPAFVRSDGIPVVAGAAPPAEDGVLLGIGVGTGRASGPVRVLHVPDPSLVEEGDVLVVRFADPGWTPLFPRAAALVMEVGGLMCHAAVVARELGIPAVFGVTGATTALPPGHLVEVDADLGSVTVR
jgi:phosphohistidine swiveling domain-containing protein